MTPSVWYALSPVLGFSRRCFEEPIPYPSYGHPVANIVQVEDENLIQTMWVDLHIQTIVHIDEALSSFLDLWIDTWRVCEFHTTCHLLSWAAGGRATNSLSHVHYLAVSYSQYRAGRIINSSQYRAGRIINSTQSINSVLNVEMTPRMSVNFMKFHLLWDPGGLMGSLSRVTIHW